MKPGLNLKEEAGDVRESLEGLLVTPAPASPAPAPEWREVRKKSKEERKSASPKPKEDSATKGTSYS